MFPETIQYKTIVYTICREYKLSEANTNTSWLTTESSDWSFKSHDLDCFEECVPTLMAYNNAISNNLSEKRYL